MHILLISRGIPTRRDPQWGSFEFDQAKALSKLGHKVTIASVDTRFRLYWRKPGLTTSELEGVACYTYFLCPGVITNLVGHWLTDKCVGWQWKLLGKRIRQDKGKIDVIYSHYLFNSYYAVSFLKDLNAPIVAMEHWSEINKPTISTSILKMGNVVYSQVDKLLTVSIAAQNAIRKHFGIDSTVVHNMVGDNFLYFADSHSYDKVRYISIGSLIQRKGFDLLIEAFSQLQLPLDTWELNIIGSGAEQNHLEKQIRNAHLERNIHLLGHRTANEIVNLLNASDIFVLPSRIETFGVVYIEAMVCGLPVIATPCGGPEEFVTAMNGLLVPIDDAEALAKAVKYMYEHHQEYDRKAIAYDCQMRFSSDVIAHKLTSIFHEVIKNDRKNHFF